MACVARRSWAGEQLGGRAAGRCDTALGAKTQPGARAERHCDKAGGQAGGSTARALGARPRRVAGLWAVHLVHSACFLPGLT